MKLNKIQIVGAFIVIGIFFISMIYTFISAINILINKENTKSTIIKVDFAQLYPFKENNKNNNKQTIIEKYKKIINDIEEKITNYTSKNLINYEKLIENSYLYNKLIGYKLVSNSNENARIEIDDGYYSRIMNKRDVSVLTNNLINFKNYLKNLKIDLLYIQAPYKISETQKISSVYRDYTNENMNNFLENINGKVNYLDLRENIKNNNLNHLELFYKTDHHWIPETGLWATREISQYLNESYNMNLQIENIKNEDFYIKKFENMYLGSDGRYVSLANAKPENFDLIIPKYDTKLTVKIPDKNIIKTDSFENTLIDWTRIRYDNYYSISQYQSYGYGDRPLIEIHNEYIKNNKKILMIRDSFGDVVIPFLALENEYTSVIDLRKFNGSIKTYIEEYNPDIVIIMYNGDMIIEEDAEFFNMWQFN